MTRLALIVLVVAAAATHVFADAPSASRSAPLTPRVAPTRGAGPSPAPLPARVPASPTPSGRAPGNPPCIASWYGDAHAGRATASGEPFDPSALTAAHPTVAFGTLLEVTAETRTVTVEVTDRGPASWTGRCIDLSEAAFEQLAPLGQGLVEVLVEETS